MLKRKGIDAKEYRDLEDLRVRIAAFIDAYYNRYDCLRRMDIVYQRNLKK